MLWASFLYCLQILTGDEFHVPVYFHTCWRVSLCLLHPLHVLLYSFRVFVSSVARFHPLYSCSCSHTPCVSLYAYDCVSFLALIVALRFIPVKPHLSFSIFTHKIFSRSAFIYDDVKVIWTLLILCLRVNRIRSYSFSFLWFWQNSCLPSKIEWHGECLTSSFYAMLNVSIRHSYPFMYTTCVYLFCLIQKQSIMSSREI